MSNNVVTSAPATSELTGAPSRKICHLYWMDDGRIGRELGIDVRGLCGFWFAPPRRDQELERGALDAKSRDCRRCVAVLAKYNRTGSGPIWMG